MADWPSPRTAMLPASVRRRFVHGLATGAAVAVLSAGCSDLGENDSSSPSPTRPGTSRSTSPSPPATRSQAVVDWPKIAAKAEPSVVSISVVGQLGAGQGSGVIIDSDGHVLTNNHVVAPATGTGQVQVSLADARVFNARLVGNDPTTDLAVLELIDPPADVRGLEFGDSEAVTVGQPVMALGNPLGLSHTVTLGIVSALDRPVVTDGRSSTSAQQATPVVTNAIQTDAAVNPGNSGGALVDHEGRLIGINSSIATLGASYGGPGGSIGLGFAIPANQAQWVAEELIDSGRVQHAYLGVTLQNVVVAIDDASREAAGVTAVVPDTSAAQAGLRAGDAVLQVDDEIVAGAESLVAQIRERPPGTRVDLKVVRAGQTRNVTVEFGTRAGR